MGAVCSCSDVSRNKQAIPMLPSPEKELQCFHDFVNGNLIEAHSHHGLKEAFDKLGGTDDGYLSRSEMKSTLSGLRYPGDASNLFDIFDVDNSDFVTREEFVASTKVNFIESGPLRRMRRFFQKQYPAAHYDDSLDQAFHAMDIHEGRHTEIVLKPDFCKLLQEQQYNGDAGTAYEILDFNRNQKVTYGEFKKVLHHLTRHKIVEKFDTHTYVTVTEK